MEYSLAIDGAPDAVPGGTAVLLVHPSTAETDRVDTDFLKTDTDHFLVVSTRTTAREVKQKLEHYGVDESKADIVDTMSVDRGLSRRSADHIHYVAAPDDVDGIVAKTREFLQSHEGKLRVSFDSLTELAYYAGEERALTALEAIVELLDEHDAVGLFHLDREVHDDESVARFREVCAGVVDLDEDGALTSEF